MEEKMNKTKAVILHLQKHGKINTMEAIKEYQATRLSAIIYNLRHSYKMKIINERVDFIDIYGTKSHYDNYILINDDLS